MSKKQWVGIDVCYRSLDVYIRPSGKFFQVTNDEVGIGKLVQTLNNIEPELIVLYLKRRGAWKSMQQFN